MLDHGMFQNMARGNRLRKDLQLEMTEGFEYGMSQDYQCLHIPLDKAISLSATSDQFGKEIDQAQVKKGNKVQLLPACKLNNVRYRLLLDINPELLELADISMPHIVEPGQWSKVSISAKFNRDCDISNLHYLVRIYLCW